MIVIPRTAGSIYDGEGAAWKPSKLDGQPIVRVRCPKGHVGILDHSVAADGTVSPSVECQSCDWHVFARLEGWPP